MEIKRCPFCGAKDINVWCNSGRYGRFVYVECRVCGARTKSRGVGKCSYLKECKSTDDCCREYALQRIEDSISAWNMRMGGDE